jgi:maleylacetate reductase
LQEFVHEALPGRVLFGLGAVSRVADEVARLACDRVLLIAGGSAHAAGARIGEALGARLAGTFDDVRQHVPEQLAEQASAAAREVDADVVVSVGGGSATGLAKSVGVALSLPIVAVPTTYSGSEVTPIWAVTGQEKRTARDLRALPRVVVYDPALTVGLPPEVTAASGLNAIAQAVPALTAPADDPVAALHAEEGVRLLARALPEAVARPDDVDARGEALLGAYLAASALAVSATGLHHALAHLLGGRHRLRHAHVHAALLPHSVALERDAGTSLDALGRALGDDDVPAALHRLALAIGAPTALRELGLPREALPHIAAHAAAHLRERLARPVDPARLTQLLERAYEGSPP